MLSLAVDGGDVGVVGVGGGAEVASGLLPELDLLILSIFSDKLRSFKAQPSNASLAELIYTRHGARAVQ